MSSYTPSKQLYYYKNKKKIVEKYREKRKEYWKKYYAANKERLALKNKKDAERRKLKKEVERYGTVANPS